MLIFFSSPDNKGSTMMEFGVCLKCVLSVRLYICDWTKKYNNHKGMYILWLKVFHLVALNRKGADKLYV